MKSLAVLATQNHPEHAVDGRAERAPSSRTKPVIAATRRTKSGTADTCSTQKCSPGTWVLQPCRARARDSAVESFEAKPKASSVSVEVPKTVIPGLHRLSRLRLSTPERHPVWRSAGAAISLVDAGSADGLAGGLRVQPRQEATLRLQDLLHSSIKHSICWTRVSDRYLRLCTWHARKLTAGPVAINSAALQRRLIDEDGLSGPCVQRSVDAFSSMSDLREDRSALACVSE